MAQLSVGFQTRIELWAHYILTICGGSEATEEIVIVSLATAPDSCVELRTAIVMFRAGLPSSDQRST